jgi:hypothetical protein
VNARLEFLNTFCTDLLANPNNGWESGNMNKAVWNL